MHLLALSSDTSMPSWVAELFVPMASGYRPVAVTLGILAMDPTLVVIVASWLRRMYWIYVATALVVVFLVVVRGLTVGFRPRREPRPERPARGAAERPVPVAAPEA